MTEPLALLNALNATVYASGVMWISVTLSKNVPAGTSMDATRRNRHTKHPWTLVSHGSHIYNNDSEPLGSGFNFHGTISERYFMIMPRGRSVPVSFFSESVRFGKQVFNNASGRVGSGYKVLGAISVRKADF